MRSPISRSLSFVLLILCLCLCLANDGFADTKRETIDGVLHVHNGAEPAGGVESFTMREQWQVGGDDGEVFFGLITRVEADAEGNAYVLDSQLNQVSVFSPEGDLLRTLFREGEGPGEVRRPRDMMLMGDGRVGVIQEFPGVVDFVDNEGIPAGRLRLGGTAGGNYILTACDAAGSHLVLSGGTQAPSETPGVMDRTYILSGFDEQGVETHRYCETHAVYDYNTFRFSEREHAPGFWWCFSVGADGRVCVAPDRDRYMFQVFDPSGNLEMVVHKDFEPLELGETEYEQTREIFETALRPFFTDYELITEKTAPVIAHMQRGLRIRENGEIWALGARGIRALPEGVLAVIDVFDQDGSFSRQMELRGPGNAVRDGVFFAGDNRVIVVKGYLESLGAQFGSGSTATDEDDGAESYLSVISYELVR